MPLCAFFSDTTLKAGGYLTIEDAQGSTVETFLGEGFLDFLKKVFDKSFSPITTCLFCNLKIYVYIFLCNISVHAGYN